MFEQGLCCHIPPEVLWKTNKKWYIYDDLERPWKTISAIGHGVLHKCVARFVSDC